MPKNGVGGVPPPVGRRFQGSTGPLGEGRFGAPRPAHLCVIGQRHQLMTNGKTATEGYEVARMSFCKDALGSFGFGYHCIRFFRIIVIKSGSPIVRLGIT
jgi:hypothetical protein